jgi:lysophospholipase L1-like esterase
MRTRGWAYLDIEEELLRSVSPETLETLYYSHDFHPTAAGYSFIADKIAARLDR